MPTVNQKLRHFGPATKVFVTARWDDLKIWFDEGHSQSWVAAQLGIQTAALSHTIKVLIREGLPDPRPKHFTPRSLAHKIFRDWEGLCQRLPSEPFENIAKSYGCAQLTLSLEILRVSRITRRPIPKSREPTATQSLRS